MLAAQGRAVHSSTNRFTITRRTDSPNGRGTVVFVLVNIFVDMGGTRAIGPRMMKFGPDEGWSEHSLVRSLGRVSMTGDRESGLTGPTDQKGR